MLLKPATVGPIVGHTTPTSCRIWMRGDVMIENGSARRCHGLVRYRRKGDPDWQPPLLNKLEAHFDGTGVFVIDALAPLTTYEYEAGWYHEEPDLALSGKAGLESCEWPPDATYAFTTAADDPAAPRSVAIGSCRYLLRLFGGALFDERGDKIFESIDASRNDRPLHAFVMMGDQIYADDMAFINQDATIDDFLSRYREAFTQPGIRSLMRSVPTYMILDDHEIENDWPANATMRDRLVRYPHAMHAYQIYQCSHGPILGTHAGRLTGTPERFWYTFEDGCATWFVLDARTERNLDKDRRRMISQQQLDALLEWLADATGKLKLVVSSIPLFPDPGPEQGDKWSGFPAQRDAILDHIFTRKIPKVVFLSGDVHCSFVCKLGRPDIPDMAVHQVVSSPLFWPYPHMKELDFAFNTGLLTRTGAPYQSIRLSDVHSTDNYARLDLAPDNVEVTFYARKGGQLAASTSFTP
jgi:alkaline phosphatase D